MASPLEVVKPGGVDDHAIGRDMTGTGIGGSLLCAEDIRLGEDVELGTYTPNRQEVLEFASKWDPQGIHVDADGDSMMYFGDIIASGAHTMAIYQRLSVLGLEKEWDVLAGIRLRDVRFLRPVLPDRPLIGYSRVDSVDLSHPKRGLVAKSGRLINADGDAVFTIVSEAYVWRRGADKQR